MSHAARTRVLDFIRRELAPGHPDVDLERDSLIDSGIIDSLGIMKLVQFLEKDLRVKIGDDELLPENFENIDAISAFLDTKLGK